MQQLMERNKANTNFIKEYCLKCESFNPSVHLIVNPSSD